MFMRHFWDIKMSHKLRDISGSFWKFIYISKKCYIKEKYYLYAISYDLKRIQLVFL